jgi:uncharacterized protein
MSNASTPVPTLGPIEPRKRIKEVDMVRGFALFGVLLVNMFNFGAYSIVWTEPADEFAFSVMRFFFETKSWRLFSFLFGFGFALQLIRAEKPGAKFAPVYLRRMIILFVIGMGHALLYDGDILMLYAELGLVLVLFRKLPPKLLLVLSVTLLAVFPIGRAATSLLQQTEITAPTEDAVRLKEALAEIEEERRTDNYTVGSMRDVMVANAHSVVVGETLANPFARPLGSESSLAMFAMFLLGLYVGRRRIFHDIPKHINLIRRVFWWGLSIGLVSMSTERILNATTGYAVFREQQATVLPQLFGDVLFVYGSTALSLGYAAAITLLAQHKWVAHVQHAVLWLCLWQRLLARPSSGDGIRHTVFHDSGRHMCLVGKPIPLWTDGVVMAQPYVLADRIGAFTSSTVWSGPRRPMMSFRLFAVSGGGAFGK